MKDTKEEVALKVQRPDMTRNVSLDLYLLNKYGELVDVITSKFTEQSPFHAAFIDCFAQGSYKVCHVNFLSSNVLLVLLWLATLRRLQREKQRYSPIRIVF